MDHRDIFYSSIRNTLFQGRLTKSQVEGMENLLDVWSSYMWKAGVAPGVDRSFLAYNLATAFHETAQTMQPIMERGSVAYFDKYEPGTRIGKMLGNTVKGDGFRFRGQGHVQNTGRRNAIKASQELTKIMGEEIDLVADPGLRGDPLISALSLFVGNAQGWWTGKKLSDYIDDKDEADAEDLREFVKARYVVNGTDKAETIGRYALAFERALKAAGY